MEFLRRVITAISHAKAGWETLSARVRLRPFSEVQEVQADIDSSHYSP